MFLLLSAYILYLSASSSSFSSSSSYSSSSSFHTTEVSKRQCSVASVFVQIRPVQSEQPINDTFM